MDGAPTVGTAEPSVNKAAADVPKAAAEAPPPATPNTQPSTELQMMLELLSLKKFAQRLHAAGYSTAADFTANPERWRAIVLPQRERDAIATYVATRTGPTAAEAAAASERQRRFADVRAALAAVQELHIQKAEIERKRAALERPAGGGVGVGAGGSRRASTTPTANAGAGDAGGGVNGGSGGGIGDTVAARREAERDRLRRAATAVSDALDDAREALVAAQARLDAATAATAAGRPAAKAAGRGRAAAAAGTAAPDADENAGFSPRVVGEGGRGGNGGGAAKTAAPAPPRRRGYFSRAAPTASGLAASWRPPTDAPPEPAPTAAATAAGGWARDFDPAGTAEAAETAGAARPTSGGGAAQGAPRPAFKDPFDVGRGWNRPEPQAKVAALRAARLRTALAEGARAAAMEGAPLLVAGTRATPLSLGQYTPCDHWTQMRCGAAKAPL